MVLRPVTREEVPPTAPIIAPRSKCNWAWPEMNAKTAYPHVDLPFPFAPINQPTHPAHHPRLSVPGSVLKSS